MADASSTMSNTSPSAPPTAAPAAQRTQIISSRRPSIALFKAAPDGESWATTLLKAAKETQESASGQPTAVGRRLHPFDMANAAMFVTANEHHAAAILAKTNATTGLGFLTELDKMLRRQQQRAKLGIIDENPPTVSDEVLADDRSKVAKLLDPLCKISFMDLAAHYGQDLSNTHNGYIEVVRKGSDPINGPITGLHHVPAHEVYIFVENQQHDYHFEVQPSNADNRQPRKFCRFGDKKAFFERSTGGKAPGSNGATPETTSEIIHIPFASSISRYYGVPTWLSAVAAIELVQALTQHEFDFYNNRGVPEFLLFLLGKQLTPEQWAPVVALFQDMVGPRNAHKTGAFNLPEGVVVQLEKLAMEGKSDGRFSEMSGALSLKIVSGHRIPPLLAGITIPGKLGAANETANALMSYQVLTVAPDQEQIQAVLGNTLGNPAVNGGLKLAYEDFEARTILDVMDINRIDTVSRMKEPAATAAAGGRNLDAGLKKAYDAVTPEERLEAVLSMLLVEAHGGRA